MNTSREQDSQPDECIETEQGHSAYVVEQPSGEVTADSAREGVGMDKGATEASMGECVLCGAVAVCRAQLCRWCEEEGFDTTDSNAQVDWPSSDHNGSAMSTIDETFAGVADDTTTIEPPFGDNPGGCGSDSVEPSTAINTTNSSCDDERENRSAATPEEYSVSEERIACAHCGRCFGPTALSRHANICRKVFCTKRKKFSMTKQRLRGELDPQQLKALAKGLRTGSSTTKQSSWRKQSADFQQAMQASREMESEKTSLAGRGNQQRRVRGNQKSSKRSLR